MKDLMIASLQAEILMLGIPIV